MITARSRARRPPRPRLRTTRSRHRPRPNPRRPWVVYATLVEELGSADGVLRQELATETEPVGQTTLLPPQAPDANELIAQAHADLDRWRTQGMRLVTVLEPDYPPNLRAVHD